MDTDMKNPLSRVEIEAYRKPRKRDGWEIDLLARTALHYLDRLAETERERDELRTAFAKRDANARTYRRDWKDAEARLAEAQAAQEGLRAIVLELASHFTEDHMPGDLYDRVQAALASSGADSGKGRTLSEEKIWKCAKGHWTTNPAPEPGKGNGPSEEAPDRPGHCPYPCLAPVVGWTQVALALLEGERREEGQE